MLYLILQNYKNIEEEFYKPVFNEYNNYNEVKNHNYYGYRLPEIVNQYILKYYYYDLTNFAIGWAYYEDMVLDDFDKMMTKSYKTLEKRMIKNTQKLNHLLDNITMQAEDYYIFDEAKKIEEREKEYVIIWHTQRDNVVCEECAEHNGNKYYRDFDVPHRHPNCRCWLELKEL